MPASEAQIRANRNNASKSSGQKTSEGKNVSRGDALEHGLTTTKVLPEREAAEVARRTAAFIDQLKPHGEVGEDLARHAARMSVRMERCAEHENAVLADRVREALDEFVPPEVVTDPTEIARLRQAAERRALFDSSKEARLARKYEAAAERSFFRALKELRLLEKRAKAAEFEVAEEELGSILPGGDDGRGVRRPVRPGDVDAGLGEPPGVRIGRFLGVEGADRRADHGRKGSLRRPAGS
jgi:hypothetical protein